MEPQANLAMVALPPAVLTVEPVTQDTEALEGQGRHSELVVLEALAQNIIPATEAEAVVDRPALAPVVLAAYLVEVVLAAIAPVQLARKV